MADSTGEDWDAAAASFDEQPDHGLRDPVTRAAWAALLERHLPAQPGRVLDLGCGTGTLAVLLARQGFAVTGVDRSPDMLALAGEKATRAGVTVDFLIGDAADPPVSGSFDVLLSRHVLWTFPKPEVVLSCWASRLGPGGRLVLVEGRWSTGAGLPAAELFPVVERAVGPARLEKLEDPALWGGPINDERYLVCARRTPDSSR